MARHNAPLVDLLDAWDADAPSETPRDVRIGARVPASLYRRLDDARHALRASKKAIVSALVWRHVAAIKDRYGDARAPELESLVDLPAQ